MGCCRSKVRRAWPYIGIPFRPSYETYNWFQSDSLPGVDRQFEIIKSVEDVNAHKDALTKRLQSPTGCVFRVRGDSFYHDPKGCLVWRFEKSVGVYCIKDGTTYVVADTLSEFLSRIDMENSIWHKASGLWLTHWKNEAGLGIARHESRAKEISDSFYRSSNRSFSMVNRDRVWAELVACLSAPEIMYLKGYFTNYGTVCSFGAPFSHPQLLFTEG